MSVDPEDDRAADHFDPEAIVSKTNQMPVYTPPSPLALGPLEPPAGPLVSPSLAAYHPSAVPWPSDEPATTPVSAAPVTSFPSSAAPLGASEVYVEDPVSAAPSSAYPVPAPPAPASFYPPPLPRYAPPVPVYPTVAVYPPPAPVYPPVSVYPSTPAYPPPIYAQNPVSTPGWYAPQPSDKSKQTAGMLQLLLGLLLAFGGVGRLYAGNTGIGVVQVVLSGVGWTCFLCGFLFFPLFVVFLGLWAWFVIDGVLMLAGNPVDGQGRPLR